MAVNREGKAGTLANALDQPIDGVGREWAATLGREYEATVRELRRNSRSALIDVNEIGT